MVLVSMIRKGRLAIKRHKEREGQEEGEKKESKKGPGQ